MTKAFLRTRTSPSGEWRTIDPGLPVPLDVGVPINGTVYGAALNSRALVAEHAESFAAAPYKASPKAPVLFIKPANTFMHHRGSVLVPAHIGKVEACAALAIVFGKNTTRIAAADALDHVFGYTLALDLSEQHDSFYRPPIVEKCRDGFLPIGPWIVARTAIANVDAVTIQLSIDGQEKAQISTAGLVRPVAQLIADVSAFMSFRAGDVLLAALTPPGIYAAIGSEIIAAAAEISQLSCLIAVEPARDTPRSTGEAS